MGKQKKYLIKTVNLGEVGSPARILAEKYIERYGKQEFSALCRQLIVIFLSDKKEFQSWKKESLMFQRKELKKQIGETGRLLEENAKKLTELGVDNDEL